MVRDPARLLSFNLAPRDLSMRGFADLDSEANPEMWVADWSLVCRASLPMASHRILPYAAPIVSHCLKGLVAMYRKR